MQVLWSVLLTRLFSGLAMVFPSPLNTAKTDEKCVNVWSVPVGVLMVVMCTSHFLIMGGVVGTKNTVDMCCNGGKFEILHNWCYL